MDKNGIHSKLNDSIIPKLNNSIKFDIVYLFVMFYSIKKKKSNKLFKRVKKTHIKSENTFNVSKGLGIGKGGPEFES